MVLEQVQSYDKNAERLSLQWAAETGPSSYQHRLDGIQRDIISFQNEQTNEYAYWSGTYELGVDGHGKPALVTSEIAIPGRVHRTDSHAMVDSMAGNAVYVLDQIEKGNMPHEAWDTALEQLKQFRAVQEAVLTLQDGESLLGFAMNGQTTRDGIALMQITRQQNIFQYETRLIGGLSEGAAQDILKRYTSETAKQIFINEKTENPLYTAVKGKISIDLKKQKDTVAVIQDVLDARKETLTALVSTGTCRSKEVQPELDNKTIKQYDSFFIKKQHEYAIGFMQKKRIDDVPYAYIRPDIHGNQQHTSQMSDRSGVIFENTIKSKQRIQPIEEVSVSKKLSETEYLIHNHAMREMIYPEFSQVAVTDAGVKQIQRQKKEAMVIGQDSQNKTKENVIRQSQIEMPIATFLVKSESQTPPIYLEKALTITVSVHKQLHGEKIAHTEVGVGKRAAVHIHQDKKMEQEIVHQPEVSEEIPTKYVENAKKEEDVLVEVDQVSIQDVHVFIDRFADQVKQGAIKGEVKKIVWTESIDQTQTELVPVEEMEIDKDTTKTVHNLLHFLRKIIRVYAGHDSIRERRIQKIASDNFQDEYEELEAYIHVLQATRFRGHMFAMVS